MNIELLDTADYLLNRAGGATSADVCRAISTTYYALFHCLAKSCCDLFIGADPAGRADRAWHHLYRSLSHTTINDRCGQVEKMVNKGFDQKLVEFAAFTRNMQWKRERADYSFNMSPNANDALNDVGFARRHIYRYNTLAENHRKAFAVLILVKDDKHEEKLIKM